MEKVDSFGSYTSRLINEGFISESGKPLKCLHCKSNDLEEYMPFYEEHWGKIEYSVKCKECKEHVATWAYGNWSVGE